MSNPTFAPNEKVLCYHGPLFYEAKVLKALESSESSPTGEPGPHYRVHYKGWKATCGFSLLQRLAMINIASRWDEWVPARRLMKYSDEKVMLQKRAAAEQKAEAAAAAKDKGTSSKISASTSGGMRASGSGSLSALSRKEGARGTKRARDEVHSTVSLQARCCAH